MLVHGVVTTLVLCLAGAFAAGGVKQGSYTQQQTSNVQPSESIPASEVEYVDGPLAPLYDFLIQRRLQKFCKLLRDALLDDYLLSIGGYWTVFVPTDASFLYLPGGTLENLKSNPQQLRDFILYHFVTGDFPFSQIQNEMLVDSVQGSILRFNTYGQIVTVSGAQILEPDLQFELGRVHVVDHPLYPIPTGDTVSYLKSNHQRLYRLLLDAELTDYLSSGPFTILAPNDDAFNFLSVELKDALSANRSLAERILLNHVLPGSLYTGGIVDGMRWDSVGGSVITFTTKRGLMFANGIPIVLPDVPFTNGVIHVLNRVLLPEGVEADCNCKPSTGSSQQPQPQAPSGGRPPFVQPQKPTTRPNDQSFNRQTPRPSGGQSPAGRPPVGQPIAPRTPPQQPQRPPSRAGPPSRPGAPPTQVTRSPLTQPEEDFNTVLGPDLQPQVGQGRPEAPKTTRYPPSPSRRGPSPQIPGVTPGQPPRGQLPQTVSDNDVVPPEQPIVTNPPARQTPLPRGVNRQPTQAPRYPTRSQNTVRPQQTTRRPQINRPDSRVTPSIVGKVPQQPQQDFATPAPQTQRPPAGSWQQRNQVTNRPPVQPRPTTQPRVPPPPQRRPTQPRPVITPAPVAPQVTDQPFESNRQPPNCRRRTERINPSNQNLPICIETDGKECQSAPYNPTDPRPLCPTQSDCRGPNEPFNPSDNRPLCQPQAPGQGCRAPGERPYAGDRRPLCTTTPPTTQTGCRDPSAPFNPSDNRPLCSVTSSVNNVTPPQQVPQSGCRRQDEPFDNRPLCQPQAPGQGCRAPGERPYAGDRRPLCSSTPSPQTGCKDPSAPFNPSDNRPLCPVSNVTPPQVVPQSGCRRQDEPFDNRPLCQPQAPGQGCRAPGERPYAGDRRPLCTPTPPTQTGGCRDPSAPFNPSDNRPLCSTTTSINNVTPSQDIPQTGCRRQDEPFNPQDRRPLCQTETPQDCRPFQERPKPGDTRPLCSINRQPPTRVNQSHVNKGQQRPTQPQNNRNQNVQTTRRQSWQQTTRAQARQQTTRAQSWQQTTRAPRTQPTQAPVTSPNNQIDQLPPATGNQQPVPPPFEPQRGTFETRPQVSPRQPPGTQTGFYPSRPGSPSPPGTQQPQYPGSGQSQPTIRPGVKQPQYPGSRPSQPQTGTNSGRPQYPGSRPSQPQTGQPQYPGSGPSQPQTETNFGQPQYPGSGPSQPQTKQNFGQPQLPGSQPQFDPNAEQPQGPTTRPVQPQGPTTQPQPPGSRPAQPQTPGSRTTTPRHNLRGPIHRRLQPPSPGSPSQPQTETNFGQPQYPGSGPSQPQTEQNFGQPQLPGSQPQFDPNAEQPQAPGSRPAQPQTPGSRTTTPRHNLRGPIHRRPQPPSPGSPSQGTFGPQQPGQTPSNQPIDSGVSGRQPFVPQRRPVSPSRPQTGGQVTSYPGRVTTSPRVPVSVDGTSTTPGEDTRRSLFEIVEDPSLLIRGTPVKMTKIFSLFQKAGLDDILSGPGPTTVFLPADDAFAALPRGVVEQLEENPELLRQVLLYHVTNIEILPTAQGESYTVPSMEGTLIPITMLNGGRLILISGAKAIAVTRANNGIFYVINKLLYPLPHENIVGAIQSRPDLSTLSWLLSQSGLTELLQDETPYTLLAPTDSAFAKLSPAALDELTQNTTALQELLLNHVVEGAHYGREFLTGGTFPSLRGGKLKFQVVSYGYQVNEINIKTPEIVTGTGVIHLIDDIILEDSDLKFLSRFDDSVTEPDNTLDPIGGFEPNRQPPSSSGQNFGSGQQPNQGTGQQPNFGTGQQPNQGNRQQPNQGTRQQPNQGTRQQPNFGTGQQPNQGTGQQPNLGTGGQNFGSGQQPNLGTGISRRGPSQGGQTHTTGLQPVQPQGRVPVGQGPQAGNRQTTFGQPTLGGRRPVTGGHQQTTFQGQGGSGQMTNVAEFARSMGLNKFANWITNTGLLEKIHDGGVYTVFAPTDDAVNSLPQDMVYSIDSNPEQTKSLLQYHIIPRKLNINSLSNDETSSTLLQGKTIRFNVYQTAQTECKQIVTASGTPIGDSQMNMGSIQLIPVSQVLYQPTGNLLNIIDASPILQSLSQVIKSTRLNWVLSGTGPLTFFAPSDTAFQSLSAEEKQTLIDDKQAFTDFLKRHLVRGTFFSSGVQEDVQKDSEANTPMIISLQEGILTVNSVPVAYSDITATNGVLHVIDQFL